MASSHLHKINEQSETFTFQNSTGSSNLDLTITNNLIADVHEWKPVNTDLFRPQFPKYKNGKDNSYENKYQCIRYIIK